MAESLETLSGIIGLRVGSIDRFSLADYTPDYVIGSEKLFESTDGPVVLSFLDSDVGLELWVEESKMAVGISLIDDTKGLEEEDSVKTDSDYCLVGSTDDFPLWASVRGRTIESCGVVNWDRGDAAHGLPESAGAYFDLGDGVEVLFACQLVSRGEDLLRTASLPLHLRSRLLYTPA